MNAENVENIENAAKANGDGPYDAIVIGTGFAGAVTAARLVQARQKICVLERGRKYEGNDFPMYPDAEALLDMDGGTKPSGAAPDLARWLWSSTRASMTCAIWTTWSRCRPRAMAAAR
ncbi:MAG: NAD(P)-binding protein [Rhizobiales bacterium]|nr:NAD(P)-binding protein [Hyphomicrobiales bacterium]